ncbi:mechanosensitive ion channel domain-containing protein [Tateyamaria sp.]|uniref:mechanosensitive ion channel domain-containing protein n=1 Tax=Tateyamaria sp. TaxID=1929288 RepID=UPI00329E869A
MLVLSVFEPILENSTWLAVCIIVALGVWLFGKRAALLRRFVSAHPVKSALADVLAAPLLVLLVGSCAQILLTRYGPVGANGYVADPVLLVLFLTVAMCFARLVELFLVSRRAQGDASCLPGLQRGLLFAGFLFAGLMSFLYLQGYSITGLSISTGAVAALVAFAMQQTLGDLFSGIALSIEHPFKLGERIRLADGSEGRVVDINWRATRLLAWDNSTLVVPNSDLAKQGFTNLHGTDHPYAPWYEVKIPAEVDPRLARALLLEAALKCSKILKSPLPVVRLTDATTLPYTYMVWVHFPNYLAMFAGREQLFQEIHYALKEVGAQVSPGVHELHTRKTDTMLVDPPTTFLALKMLDISKSLSDEELEQLAEMSSHKTFEAGTVLVAEGEISKSLDVILHGVVETSVLSATGPARVVDHLRSGQYFGLTSMLMDTPSFMQFTASTNVTLIRIDIDCLRHILNDRSDLHDEFAIIMKQRMDSAQDARLEDAAPIKRFTIKDFLRRFEQWNSE